MSKIEVNTVEPQCGTTLTLGGSGDTVTLGTGASQSGFGREGSVDWDTSSIKTSTFSAVSGNGYFCNTSGGAFTVNLPAGSAGAIVAVSDYSRTFNTYNLTISPNGSEKIGGVNDDIKLDVEGQAATFVYVDSTKGWINVQNSEDTEAAGTYITATGGTISTVCTNYKVHVFTGPGTFCVSAGAGPKSKVDYLVIGGGASGANNRGGGGGAGGYRESHSVPVSGCYTAAPTAASIPLGPLSPGPISVTVGGGAPSVAYPPNDQPGGAGSVSTFSTITSAGGGGGGYGTTGTAGGSGGGGGYPNSAGGAGNTPSVSPPQGNPGGTSSSTNSGSGGGGSGAAGGASSNCNAGNGGAGLTTEITGSPVQRGGGGGGSGNSSGGSAGAGGGGAGYGGPSGANPNDDGTANTGGGGGGSRNSPSGGGGSGIVVIRYRFQ